MPGRSGVCILETAIKAASKLIADPYLIYLETTIDREERLSIFETPFVFRLGNKGTDGIFPSLRRTPVIPITDGCHSRESGNPLSPES
jgi:hypothetical protein